MLNAVDAVQPGTGAAVRALVPAASLQAIDDMPGVCWLDFEHDHWLMDGTLRVLGKELAVRCWRAGMTSLIHRPVLKNFAEAGLRLFLGKPGQVIALIPRGWPLAYRDFCTPSFHRTGDHQAEIRFEAIAPEAFASPGYLHCWHGICQGILDLEKPRGGQVDLTIEESRRRAVASFSWLPPEP
jgi:hypothetical protein